MPGRKFNSGNYRFGFNGMEKNPEINNGSYTTEFRQLDTRIGRWLSLDPASAKYPGQSPYNTFLNNPIFYTDPDGDDPPEKEEIYNNTRTEVSSGQNIFSDKGGTWSSTSTTNEKLEMDPRNGNMTMTTTNNTLITSVYGDGTTETNTFSSTSTSTKSYTQVTGEEYKWSSPKGAGFGTGVVTGFFDMLSSNSYQAKADRIRKSGKSYAANTYRIPNPIEGVVSMGENLYYQYQYGNSYHWGQTAGQVGGSILLAKVLSGHGGNINIGKTQLSFMSKVTAPGMSGHRVLGLKVGKHQYAIDFHNWVMRKGNAAPIQTKFWHYHWGRGKTGKHHRQFVSKVKITSEEMLKDGLFGKY
jgi:RHS repeat-associated protein